MSRPLVLVVGGGFAGVDAARQLSRSGVCDVLLVDVVNFSLFTPMLPEVATGDIETRHILVPHRDLLRPGHFRQGRVLSLDREAGTAVVETTVMPRRDNIRFDHALFAPGGVTNFYGIQGAAEHCITLKTIGDAIYLRNHVLALFERAWVEPSAEGRERLCRLVVVGGGYSGVELAAAMGDFFRAARRQYPELARHLEVVLVERENRVTPSLPPRLQEACRRKLLQSGVDVRLGTSVREVAAESVTLGDGDVLPTLATVWTAGVKPSPDLQVWGLPLDDRGRVRVDRTLRVEGAERLWAAGDAAAVPMGDGDLAPPTAQHATRQGKQAAGNILAALGGRAPQPYTYRTVGELVSLGHRSAVGTVMGLQVRGFPAWWMWRTYYLFRLPSWLRRVRVAFDWTVDLFFQRDVVQLPMGRGGRSPDQPGSR